MHRKLRRRTARFFERLEERTVLSGFVEGFGGAGTEFPLRNPSLDPAGNMYVSGYFNSSPADFDPGPGVDNLSSAGGSDAFIAKYNSDGSLAWARSFGGSSSDNGQQAVYAHESTGDYVYFGGLFSGTVDFGTGANGQDIMLTSAGGEDAFVMKMDATTGATVWAEQFGGVGDDYPVYMAVANGNLYVTGEFTGTVDFDPGPGTANLTDPTGTANGSSFVLTLDSSGNYVGVFALSATGTNNILTTAGLVVDASTMYVRGLYTGTAYLDPASGTPTVTSTGPDNVFVAAYSIANQSPANPNPSLLWDRSLPVFASGIRGNLSEDANNLYLATIAGTNPYTNGIDVVSLSKLDGSINWQNQLSGPSTSSGISVQSTALNPADGSLYVGGSYTYPTFDFDPTHPGGEVVKSSANSTNAFILKLNSADGTYRQVWSYGAGSTLLAGISGSTLYSTGYFNGTPTFPDGTTLTSSGLNDGYLMSLDTSAPQLSINSVSQPEANSGSQPMTFTVTRSGDTSGTTTVNWTTADGTATAASGDYVAASGQLTFAPGETSQTLSITVNGDTGYELDETFRVNLSNAVGGDIASGIGQATITNDDAAPNTQFSINSVSQAEGNSGTTPFIFTVTRSGDTTVTSIVNWATADGPTINGSATAASGDYVAASGQLTFAPGQTTATITVLINGDTVPEANEAFSVNLSNPYNATVTTGTGWGTIVDDDNAHLTINSVWQLEGNSGTKPFVLTIARSGNLSGTSTVNWATADDAAKAGSDYVPASGQLTFAPGQTSQTVTVMVNGDTTVESVEEDFAVNLSNPIGAVLDKTTGYGFIVDDDVSVSINNISQPEGNSGHTPFTFTVTRTGGDIGDPTTLNWSTADGTATASSGDYVAASGQITFAANQTTAAITVNVNGDTTVEANESFSVNISAAPTSVTGFTSSTGTATIVNDDVPPVTKFYVANDGNPDRTYEYSATGAPVENYAIASANTAPRGIASTAAGTQTWVVDANKNVYAYNTSGALLGSWSAGSLPGDANVQGITTNGTDVWIVDAKSDKVYRYANAASRLSGTQTAASSFNLNASNAAPTDLVTDGSSIWVTNNSKTDQVFKYTVSGTLLGKWTLDSGDSSPTGITIDPSNVSNIWIVDNVALKIFQYNNAASVTSGNLKAAATYALSAGNTNPQGIADPPPAVAGVVNNSAALRAHSDALLSVASELETIFGLGRKRR